MGKTTDGYKRQREAYRAEAMRHHTLLCSFFGKPVEPVAEVHERLNAQLQAHEVNQMTAEIAEIIEEGA